jgi:hypothetical protein
MKAHMSMTEFLVGTVAQQCKINTCVSPALHLNYTEDTTVMRKHSSNEHLHRQLLCKMIITSLGNEFTSTSTSPHPVAKLPLLSITLA